MAARINSEQFQQEVLESALPVIVDFYSDACIPCKQLSPILGDIEDDYEGRIKIVKVNVNFDTELAVQYGVMAAPTLLFFKEGQETNRVRGLIRKPELETYLEELLGS